MRSQISNASLSNDKLLAEKWSKRGSTNVGYDVVCDVGYVDLNVNYKLTFSALVNEIESSEEETDQ